MKSAIKKLLPQSVINAARALRDGHAVNTLAPLNFTAENLKPANSLEFSSIWADKDIATCWQKDCDEISSVFPESDKWGGINPGDRRALYYLISALKPQNVLEVGTHIGASSVYIAKAMSRYAQEEASLTTVDILDVNDPQTGAWAGLGMERSPQGNLEALDCGELCNFVVNSAQDYMAALADDDGKRFDFIFLDGDHTAKGVYHEMALALKILKPGGVILLHDYYPDGQALFRDGNIIYGPFKALESVRGQAPNVTVKPLGTLAWPTKQGSSNTSLALVMQSAGEDGE
ncbi:MAG TPA: class I SAM-dependent methyltransferase [Alphaproteobacteria bacterium]|nr:class I SAM-dependent methyltransferase [Alphaproteobacteria bacterium]